MILELSIQISYTLHFALVVWAGTNQGRQARPRSPKKPSPREINKLLKFDFGLTPAGCIMYASKFWRTGQTQPHAPCPWVHILNFQISERRVTASNHRAVTDFVERLEKSRVAGRRLNTPWKWAQGKLSVPGSRDEAAGVKFKIGLEKRHSCVENTKR